MRRPGLLIGIIFGGSLLVILGGMAWISAVAVDLEREALRRNNHEENVRVALWRMHGVLAPLISEESGRPYFHYRSYYPAQRAYTRMLCAIEPGDVLVASPLQTRPTPFVRLHFQIGSDGALTSPQVPRETPTPTDEPGSPAIAAAHERLAQLKATVDANRLWATLNEADPSVVAISSAPAFAPFSVARTDDDASPPHPLPPPAPPMTRGQAPAQVGQTLRNRIEAESRTQQRVQQQEMYQTLDFLGPDARADVRVGPFAAAWIGDELLLLRRVTLPDEQWLQGCWIDWDALRPHLHGAIADLFPAARLEPVVGAAADPSRLLTLLPVRLTEGPTAIEIAPALSPVRRSLWITWSAALLAVIAVVVLMAGTLRLSEKRAAFVSAVTHELRTPLTTFRLYTDLLAKDESDRPASNPADVQASKRRQYVETLRHEAARLANLIENVLTYARLERGVAHRAEPIAGGDLLARVHETLLERAAQAGAQLQVSADSLARQTRLQVDVPAVERILLNLVDNACKHAAPACDAARHQASLAPNIELLAARNGTAWVATVRDGGPGVDPQTARRLFRPFHRSRHAVSGGIGLGLALSRRLARRLGGDLTLEPGNGSGACFRLTLPAR